MKYQVSRETERLDIGDGLWVEVKKELNHGELQKLRSTLYTYDLKGEPITKSNTESASVTYVSTVLTDWNLQADNGKKLPLNQDIVATLDDNFVIKLMEMLKSYYTKGSQDDGKKKEI